MATSLNLKELENLPVKQQGRRPASDVKKSWREIVNEVNTVGDVLVTNHNRPEVVVVSVERYAKLKRDAAANDPLETLRSTFDRELAVLQSGKAAGTLRRAFASTPRELADAANAAARRKR
jgi:prevent-host-death family protein